MTLKLSALESTYAQLTQEKERLQRLKACLETAQKILSTPPAPAPMFTIAPEPEAHASPQPKTPPPLAHDLDGDELLEKYFDVQAYYHDPIS